MIELTVALLSGLIVAMGIVALSREATATFNSETRISSAESSLRAAMDRLRTDVERAGFMSTGNILTDPALATIPGSTPGSTNTSTYKPSKVAPTGIGMSGLVGLASVFWCDNGSNGAACGVNNLLASSAGQTPVLTPDLIQIAGNMTTAEQFDVQMVAQNNAACGAGGVIITLSPSSPAMVRTLGGTIVTGANATSMGLLLQNLFTPDPTGAAQFLLRLVDKTNHSQFLAVCPVSAGQPSAGFDAALQPFVRVDGTNTPVLYAKNASGGTSNVGGVAGFCVGCIVNPVQIVQWEVTAATGAPADPEPTPANAIGNGYGAFATKVADPVKYDLMRTYLSASGGFVGSTSEIVAEYAVDLAFAFTGDNGLTSLNPAAPGLATAVPFDDATNNAPWGRQAWASLGSQLAPQRIRSVRVRLATRAALPDRTTASAAANGSIPLAPAQYPAGTPFQTFMYRYKVTGPAPYTFARVRTMTTEVALQNQSRNFY